MHVLGRRRAVSKQARMVGEASIGFDDRRSRARRVEHAVHVELDPVKAGAPDHLAHIGKHDQMPARVGDANGLDAGLVSEKIGAKIAEPDDRALLVAEKAALQHDLGAPTLRLLLQSLLPAPTTAVASDISREHERREGGSATADQETAESQNSEPKGGSTGATAAIRPRKSPSCDARA